MVDAVQLDHTMPQKKNVIFRRKMAKNTDFWQVYDPSNRGAKNPNKRLFFQDLYKHVHFHTHSIFPQPIFSLIVTFP